MFVEIESTNVLPYTTWDLARRGLSLMERLSAEGFKGLVFWTLDTELPFGIVFLILLVMDNN